MQGQYVFQDKKERERLAVQNRLLSSLEAPALEKIFFKKSNLCVLDIGCNDGNKTVSRFSSPSVSKVIGLEYNAELAEAAQEKYGDGKYAFYCADVENAAFSEQLSALAAENGAAGFDLIYLSFVLMHLRDPQRLLKTLRRFLKPDGLLFIVETNDGASSLTPDKNGLLADFLNILRQDMYAGNRNVGEKLPELLTACGYGNITVWSEKISASEGEVELKKDIFKTFFSYLPDDVAILTSEYPKNAEYRAWSAWLDNSFATLKQLVESESSSISMGMKILSCAANNTD